MEYIRIFQKYRPCALLSEMLKLFLNENMLLLMPLSIFTGFSPIFFYGIYSTSLGFTINFSNSKGLAAMHGIICGIGGMMGGAFITIFGKWSNKYGRYPFLILGVGCVFVGLLFTLLNIPEKANYEETLGNFYYNEMQCILNEILCSTFPLADDYFEIFEKLVFFWFSECFFFNLK